MLILLDTHYNRIDLFDIRYLPEIPCTEPPAVILLSMPLPGSVAPIQHAEAEIRVTPRTPHPQLGGTIQGDKKKNWFSVAARRTILLRWVFGIVQTSLRTGPCPRKANSELADCHIQTPPLVPALAAILASRSRKSARHQFSRSHSHLVRVPTTLTFCNGGRDIKSLLPFRFNGNQEGS